MSVDIKRIEELLRQLESKQSGLKWLDTWGERFVSDASVSVETSSHSQRAEHGYYQAMGMIEAAAKLQLGVYLDYARGKASDEIVALKAQIIALIEPEGEAP